MVNAGVPGTTAAQWAEYFEGNGGVPSIPICATTANVRNIWLSVGGNDVLFANCNFNTELSNRIQSALGTCVTSLQELYPDASIGENQKEPRK